MRRQTCLTVMLLVSLVASSSGQVYGRKQQTVDNAVLTAMVSIPQVNADGDKISGTYIPISATASAQDIGGPVADKVTAVRLKQAVLTVGGETLYTDNFNVSWSEPSPVTQKRSARSQSVMLSSNESGDFVLEGGQGSPPVPFADIKDPRDPIFSSTHFVHEVQVVVSLTLTFSLKRASGATFDVTLESAVIKPKFSVIRL